MSESAPGDERGVGLTALRRLSGLIGRISAQHNLTETLQSVAESVLEGAGFGIAVVNLVGTDGWYETVAVAGSDEARRELIGRRYTAADFAEEFERADRWGALLFVAHDRYGEGEHPPGFVPDLPASDDPSAWHPLDALYAPLHNAVGQVVGMISVDLPADGRRPGPLQRALLEILAAQAGIAVDNARLKEALEDEQHRLRASEEAFRLAFEGATVGMAIMGVRPSERGRWLRVNGELARIAARPAAGLLGRPAADILHPDDRGTALAALDAAVEYNHPNRTETRLVRPDGTTAWAAMTLSPVAGPDGRAVFVVSLVEDVTQQRAAAEELARRALQDPLTGLPNRVLFRDRLDAAVEKVRRTGRRGALLFCDLDGFKDVNDVLGHSAGDDVLTTVARRLAAEVRAADVVARLGGDEFVVLAEEIGHDEVHVLAERMRAAVARPVEHLGQQVSVTVSIGIAMLDEGQVGSDELLRLADAAMYAAKTRGRDQVVVASADVS